MTEKIKVLVVDDSALIRSVMKQIIVSQPDMELVGVAPDAIVAREMIRETNPDVLTLDVGMPVMDGLEFLEKLMRLRPMPVIMVSRYTEKGSHITMRAMELGAVDFVTKPRMGIESGMQDYADEIAMKIRVASQARVKPHAGHEPVKKLAAESAAPPVSGFNSGEKLIIIGASTGGTEAVKDFLMQMPIDCPGILIAQHMPEGFTKSFAERLNNLCHISVKEAMGNERILPGQAYIAPGNAHLRLIRREGHYLTHVDRKSEPVNRHRPSVDVLFRSVAAHGGKRAVGVILTGMGDDGAQGMLEMRKAGAYNFAQDEESSVVFGMPREAIEAGAVHEVGALKDLPKMVLAYLAKNSLPKTGIKA